MFHAEARWRTYENEAKKRAFPAKAGKETYLCHQPTRVLMFEAVAQHADEQEADCNHLAIWCDSLPTASQMYGVSEATMTLRITRQEHEAPSGLATGEACDQHLRSGRHGEISLDEYREISAWFQQFGIRERIHLPQVSTAQELQIKAQTRLASLMEEKLVTRVSVLSTFLGGGKTTERLLVRISVETHKTSPDFDQTVADNAKNRIKQALGEIGCDVFIETDR